jgi:glycosyltransferase involved in cell wall biosynthesis
VRTGQDDTTLDNGLVTVVIPARNEQASIGACLAGVQAQSHRHLQIIVVDGDSDDRTVESVRAAARDDPRSYAGSGGSPRGSGRASRTPPGSRRRPSGPLGARSPSAGVGRRRRRKPALPTVGRSKDPSFWSICAPELADDPLDLLAQFRGPRPRGLRATRSASHDSSARGEQRAGPGRRCLRRGRRAGRPDRTGDRPPAGGQRLATA